jgi:hypothetical protein
MESTNTIECKPKHPDSLDLAQLSNKTDLTDEEHNEGLKTYTCSYLECSKTFRYRSEITRHMVSHSDRRPYFCPYNGCNRAFKRLDALATHVRLHTGDKPFKCPVGSCQLTFATKAGLRYHTLKHKNNRLYKCDYPGCEQAFLTMSQLKQHKRGAKVHDALTTSDTQELTQNRNEGKLFNGLNVDCEKPSWLAHNEYEPSVQKRVHFPQSEITHIASMPSKQIQQLSLFESKLKSEETFKLGSRTAIGRLIPSASQLCANETSTLSPSNLTRNMSFSAKRVGKEVKDDLDLTSTTPLDQTKLLKSINKVLDENMALKQNLEFCQKIISVYQANLGELKDSQLEWKKESSFSE